jgi:chemotaxis protein MotA
MLVIGGLVAVIVAVAGGYMWHGGHLMLLWQPAEFVIIGGSAIGILLSGTPMPVIGELVRQLRRLFTPPPGTQDFNELLAMLYQLFRLAQSNGAMALESHLDNPQESAVLAKYPRFLARHSSFAFLADSIRIIIVGGIAPHDLEHLMYEDLEIRQREAMMPTNTLLKVADALPGLGIVAAVLGVVITMQAIDGSPSEIGHKVGAALVGTFLGILLSYGMMAPISQALEQRVSDDSYYCICIKAGLLAVYKGNPPAIAIEFARRVLPHSVRPSFNETEQFCRAATSPAAAGGGQMAQAA